VEDDEHRCRQVNGQLANEPQQCLDPSGGCADDDEVDGGQSVSFGGQARR
jgi:hypothetical protein